MAIARVVTVIGTGYVGMACAISLSERGFVVRGYDVNHERIHALQQGVAPYKEDGLLEALEVELSSGRLSFTTDLSTAVDESNLIIVCVNTPTKPQGHADLTDLHTVVRNLQECGIADNTYVAIRSTVPPGTCDDIAAALGERIHVVMTPEFLREGRALFDSRHPNRHIVGAATAAIGQQYAEYLRIEDAPTLFMARVDAELTKLSANSFLAVKISFANEVANLAEAFGGDVRDVLAGIGMDERIGRAFLQPGIGFGGPCLTKDLKSYEAVAVQHAVASHLVSATLAVNQHQPLRVIERLERELGTLHQTTIGVWGLTFKAGTDDVRYSLAQDIIAELTRRGAQVRVFDPKAAKVHIAEGVVRVAKALDAAQADALLVLTEWPEFAKIPARSVASRLRHRLVVDGRNVLDGARYALEGVNYYGVGIKYISTQNSVLETVTHEVRQDQYQEQYVV